MPRFIVASYLLGKKGSLSDIKVTKDFTGLNNINLHGAYNSEHIIITRKDAGYYVPKDTPVGIFVHARNTICPGLSDSTRRMINYYDTWCYGTFLELNSPIQVLCSNLHRNEDSYIFDNIVRNSNTVLIEYDFSNKNAIEYDINGNELINYIVVAGDKVKVSGGWINTGKNLWDLFYIDRIILYSKFNPLIEYPYYHIEFLPIGACITNPKNTVATINIGGKVIKFESPRILIQTPLDSKIYSINDDGTLNEVTSNVDLNDYSSFLTYSVDWKYYFKVSDTTWNNLMSSNEYLILIHNCRPFIYITRYNAYGLDVDEYMYFRFKQWKTIPIKDTI